MSQPRIVVFISGQGTNLQALIDACKNFELCAEIVGVISNRQEAPGLYRAEQEAIPYLVQPFSKGEWPNRISYDHHVARLTRRFSPDLIVLAGWMHVFTEGFISNIGCPVINLHPALPGKFPGKQAIDDAWAAFQEGKIRETGIMVHHVISEIDAGDVILSRSVPILEDDSLSSLRARIQRMEKPLLLAAVNQVLAGLRLQGSGKSCNIHSLGDAALALQYTDRVSCFDRGVCTIPGKGLELAKQTEFWFRELESKLGIATHFLQRKGPTIIARRCKPIKIEVIVRGYLTGSLARKRSWPGLDQRVFAGLEQNQKLPHPIVTPTTKSDDHDQPIGTDEIVAQGLLQRHEWAQVKEMALQIYCYGAALLKNQGLILADTKYEFGKDVLTGKILLMDECHTSDGSRLWKSSLYADRVQNPPSLDKDFLRKYIRQNPDHQDRIPNHIKDMFLGNYQLYTRLLLGISESASVNQQMIEFLNETMVVIIAGSTKDQAWTAKIVEELKSQGLPSKVYYRSAHKTPLDVLKIIAKVPAAVYITCAGRSNALSGVVAANCTRPVIACPPFKDKSDMMVNVHSSLQCPSGTPVMTILEPSNAALAAKRIIFKRH